MSRDCRKLRYDLVGRTGLCSTKTEGGKDRNRLSGIDVLDTQCEYFPGSTLGTRARNLWRRSVSVGQMGMAMVRGLEGNDPKFLKAVACAKHYAVHSGPEGNRHTFNAQVDAYDLWDTYLPAFQALVTEAKVHGVMCAYNRLDGQPCCGHNELLHDILRNQWGFDGYVTSDCWALKDFAHNHKTHANDIEAVSDAVLKGTDLECGDLYQLLEQGVNQGLISERSVNVSLKRLLTILFKIGLFDPDSHHPYMSIDAVCWNVRPISNRPMRWLVNRWSCWRIRKISCR